MNQRIGRIGQLKVYFGKWVRLYINEGSYFNLVMTAVIMLLINAVINEDMFLKYSDTKNGGFTVVCVCIWVGLFNTIQSVCKERATIKKEHRGGMFISSYILSKLLFEILQSLVEALIISGFIFFKFRDNLPDDGIVTAAMADLCFTFFMVIFSADALGLMLSSVCKTVNLAMTVMPFILIIQLVMAGCVFPLEGMTKTISSVTISRWGLCAIGSIANQNPGIQEDIDRLNSMYKQFGLSEIELDHWDPTKKNFLFLMGILLLFVVIYTAISIIALNLTIDKDTR